MSDYSSLTMEQYDGMTMEEHAIMVKQDSIRENCMMKYNQCLRRNVTTLEKLAKNDNYIRARMETEKQKCKDMLCTSLQSAMYNQGQ
jgi:hypothetical protein